MFKIEYTNQMEIFNEPWITELKKKQWTMNLEGQMIPLQPPTPKYYEQNWVFMWLIQTQNH